MGASLLLTSRCLSLISVSMFWQFARPKSDEMKQNLIIICSRHIVFLLLVTFIWNFVNSISHIIPCIYYLLYCFLLLLSIFSSWASSKGLRSLTINWYKFVGNILERIELSASSKPRKYVSTISSWPNSFCTIPYQVLFRSLFCMLLHLLLSGRFHFIVIHRGKSGYCERMEDTYHLSLQDLAWVKVKDPICAFLP